MWCRLLIFSLSFVLSLSIMVAEKIPGSVNSLEAYQMSSSDIYLKWKAPENNYTLANYDIQYAEILNEYIDEEQFLVTVAPNSTQAKLSSIKTNKEYKIYVYSIYTSIASNPTIVDISLRLIDEYLPGKPDFKYDFDEVQHTMSITWLPDNIRPGIQFFVSYKKKDEMSFKKSHIEGEKLNIVIHNIEKNQTYQFFVVSCYYRQRVESEIKDIQT